MSVSLFNILFTLLFFFFPAITVGVQSVWKRQAAAVAGQGQPFPSAELPPKRCEAGQKDWSCRAAALVVSGWGGKGRYLGGGFSTRQIIRLGSAPLNGDYTGKRGEIGSWLLFGTYQLWVKQG